MKEVLLKLAAAVEMQKSAETAYIAAAVAYNITDRQGLSEAFKSAKAACAAASKKLSEARFELHGKIFEKWVALPGDQSDGVGLYVTHGSWSGVLPRLIPGEFWVFDTKEDASAFCEKNRFKRVFYQGDALSGGSN